VQLLDHVSRSLPDMLWLTAMTQKGTDVIVEGRSTTLIALSDFVGNLGATEFFKKPIEIVDSQVEAAPSGPQQGAAAGADVIRFTVKAALATAPTAAPARN
jgi:Tfp pilus assembly protein PilN